METIKKYHTSDFKLKDKVIINLGEAGKGIKSFWVDGIISDIHPNRITVQRNNPFGNKPLEEQIPNKQLTSEYIVKEEDAEKYANGGEVNEFDYMLLGRLKSDADFYLGHGNRNERRLWALNVDDHIKEMKNRWNALPEDKKPEWLTMEDILEYERKMKNPPKSKFDYYKVPNEQLYAIIECNPEYKDNFGTECIVIRNKKTEESAIAEVERLNKLGYSDYAKGGQLPQQKDITLLQKGLENPLIPQNIKTKIEAKIKELQSEIDKQQQEAKKAAEKPTLKDLEDRLKIVKKMAAKKPELKARVKIIEKMIAKEKKENAVEKLFSVNPSAIGKAKYSIDFYDGGKHKDGSEHIGIDTFKSKKDLTSAIEKYKKQGYKKVDNVFNELQKKNKPSKEDTERGVDNGENHIIIKHYWGNKKEEEYSENKFKEYIEENPIKNVWIGYKKINNFKFDFDDGRMIMRYSLTKNAPLKYYVSFLNHSVALKFNNAVFLQDINYTDFKNNVLTQKTLDILNTETQKKATPKMENGAEIERTDHVNSFRNALVSYIKERYNEDVDLDNTLISYVENTGNKQVERAEVTTLQGNEYTVYPKDLVDRFKNGGSIPVNVALQKTAGQPYEIIKNDIPRTEAQKFIEEYKQSGKPYHNIMIDDLPFEDGGRVPEKLKGYRVEIYKSSDGNQPLNVVSNGQFKDMVLVTDGKTGDSSVVMSNEPYLRLQNKNVFGKIYTSVVPVNIADKEWKMFGGNFVWSSDSRFREEVSEHPLPLHDRVEYEEGGEIDIYTIFEGYDHYNQKPLFIVKGKNNDYVGEWHDDRKDAEEEMEDLQPKIKNGEEVEVYDTLAFKTKKIAEKNEQEIRDYFKDRLISSKISTGKDERGNYGFQVIYTLNKEYKKGGETWIQDSVEKMEKKGTVGSFTNKAARHGLTPIEYAKKVLANPDKHTEKTRRQAQFVKNTNPELFKEGGEVKSIRFTSYDYNKLVGDVSEDYPYYSIKNADTQDVYDDKTEQKVATWYMQEEELKINQKAPKKLKEDLKKWLKRNSYITN